jgi:hypothetical protein
MVMKRGQGVNSVYFPRSVLFNDWNVCNVWNDWNRNKAFDNTLQRPVGLRYEVFALPLYIEP